MFTSLSPRGSVLLRFIYQPPCALHFQKRFWNLSWIERWIIDIIKILHWNSRKLSHFERSSLQGSRSSMSLYHKNEIAKVAQTLLSALGVRSRLEHFAPRNSSYQAGSGDLREKCFQFESFQKIPRFCKILLGSFQLVHRSIFGQQLPSTAGDLVWFKSANSWVGTLKHAGVLGKVKFKM